MGMSSDAEKSICLTFLPTDHSRQKWRTARRSARYQSGYSALARDAGRRATAPAVDGDHVASTAAPTRFVCRQPRRRRRRRRTKSISSPPRRRRRRRRRQNERDGEHNSYSSLSFELQHLLRRLEAPRHTTHGATQMMNHLSCTERIIAF